MTLPFSHSTFYSQKIGGLHMDVLHHICKKLATRILALTSSSSGCERNWSSFEAVSVVLTSLQSVSTLIL